MNFFDCLWTLIFSLFDANEKRRLMREAGGNVETSPNFFFFKDRKINVKTKSSMWHYLTLFVDYWCRQLSTTFNSIEPIYRTGCVEDIEQSASHRIFFRPLSTGTVTQYRSDVSLKNHKIYLPAVELMNSLHFNKTHEFSKTRLAIFILRWVNRTYVHTFHVLCMIKSMASRSFEKCNLWLSLK